VFIVRLIGHQESPLAVAVKECLTHPSLALAALIVPRVVHEVDAAINRGVDNAQAQVFVNVLEA
jgi:hypothetical protein